MFTGLQVYLIVAAALAGTSYFTIYRPAIELTEEILDEDLKFYRGWFGTSLWLVITAIFAPATLIVLLRNNNESFIEQFAVALANTMMDEDEDE